MLKCTASSQSVSTRTCKPWLMTCWWTCDLLQDHPGADRSGRHRLERKTPRHSPGASVSTTAPQRGAAQRGGPESTSREGSQGRRSVTWTESEAHVNVLYVTQTSPLLLTMNSLFTEALSYFKSGPGFLFLRGDLAADWLVFSLLIGWTLTCFKSPSHIHFQLFTVN